LFACDGVPEDEKGLKNLPIVKIVDAFTGEKLNSEYEMNIIYTNDHGCEFGCSESSNGNNACMCKADSDIFNVGK